MPPIHLTIGMIGKRISASTEQAGDKGVMEEYCMSTQMITDRTEYLTGMSIESLKKQVAKATGVSITAQGLSEIADGIVYWVSCQDKSYIAS